MRWKIWRPVAPAATLWLAALILLVFQAVPAAADNGRWGADYFPNVTLTTQNGAPVRFYDDLVKGKIVAINLIYTTCKYACPDSGAALGDDVRVAYCPMVQKYWLQKGETIRNPFYGKEMSDCGRITQNIPHLRK